MHEFLQVSASVRLPGSSVSRDSMVLEYKGMCDVVGGVCCVLQGGDILNTELMHTTSCISLSR